MIKQKVIFLDRDGVINEQAEPHEYIREWENFKIIPGVCEAIKIMNQSDYRIFVVSNQRGIARGKCTIEQISRLHCQMCDYLKGHGCSIDEVYICPHDEGQCNCRKPATGLFDKAQEKLAVEHMEIDKSRSWMIGDFDADMIAGHNYGIRCVRIITDHMESQRVNVESELYAGNLYDAVCKILEEES